MKVVLGEMDVARAKPKSRPGWTHPPAGAAAAANCPADNPRSPLSRWTTSTRPGVLRASGNVDNVWVGQIEGPVDAGRAIRIVNWYDLFQMLLLF